MPIEDLRAHLAAATTPRTRARRQTQLDLAVAREAILGCTACPLADTRTQAVPFYSANLPATLVIVGEAPGVAEDREGVPFVGASGKKLDRLLEMAGIARADTFIFNSVACRPPSNRTPNEVEVSACSSHFSTQLALSGAWVGLLMGASAYQRIHPTPSTISEARGIPFWSEGRVWVPTYHPAYGLRNPRMMPHIQADVQMAVDIARDDRALPLFETEDIVGRDEDKQAIRDQLDKRGWAVVNARKIGALVVCVSKPRARVPSKYAHLVHYTSEELVRIGELSEHPSPAPSVLRAIHLVKERLGGEIA